MTQPHDSERLDASTRGSATTSAPHSSTVTSSRGGSATILVPHPVPDLSPGLKIICIELPAHLCLLAKVRREVRLQVQAPITQRSILDALEAAYPMLQGTLRDHATQLRRPFIRFFACQEDLSHLSPDAPLPERVASGAEPFLVVGAVAGG